MLEETTSQEFLPIGKPIGIKLTLQAEVCSSWGYAQRKLAVEEIAKELSKLGYDVNFQLVKVPGGTGILRLSLIKDDRSEVVLFSNNKIDEGTGAIIGFNITRKIPEIIQKIKSSTS